MRLVSAVAATAALSFAAPASATVLLAENFDGEGTPGTSTLNFTAFTQFSAPASSGTVDLVNSGHFGITCAGGTGKCVDLDGSTSTAGAIASKTVFSFSAGDILTLTFDLSGNQRSLTSLDDWAAGFYAPVGTLTASSVTRDAGCGSSTLIFLTPPNPIIGINSAFCPLPGSAPFANRLLSFTAASAGNALIFFSDNNTGGDNVGPILDNVRLTITRPGAVPEPATWAMMIAGFGMIGGALRRRTSAKISFA